MIDSLSDRRDGVTEPATLRPEHAFVVEFRNAAEAAPDRLTGRVEHVVSGRATQFASSEELLAFVTRVLRAPRGGGEGGSQ